MLQCKTGFSILKKAFLGIELAKTLRHRMREFYYIMHLSTLSCYYQWRSPGQRAALESSADRRSRNDAISIIMTVINDEERR